DDSRLQSVRAILSGPAGGVRGAAFYGELLGESKIIGIDMGGTSTDISLIEDGTPHVSMEKFEGGWKIAVPMIDIQTLGAGGGSIARVDPGGILHVGPESAGADPGPACYGRGGLHPTVTDADLVLGYLDPGNFLGGKAKLEKKVAEKALEEQIGKPLRLSTVEAAHGVHRVVSTNMAEGIRLLSVKRGVDPRGFAMLAFGGAAGLHVSRVARQLQIRKVYIPAAAPVLSAYGMLNTDLRYDFSRSCPASLDGIDLNTVRSIAQELEDQGRAKLREQGVPDEEMEVVRSADMRYLDQIYEVTVPLPNLSQEDAALLDEWASNFHQRYQDLYSYHQSDQEIRLITLRVSVLGHLPRITLPEQEAGAELDKAQKGSRRMFLGEWQEAPVYAMSRMSPGMEIEGPAVLESDFTTILVEPGDTARVDRYGGIELQVALAASEKGEARPEGAEKPDPITLAVVQHRLESIAQEMAEVMLRTSMSQILNSSRDFSTAILDGDCQLIAQGEGIPVHISALPLAGAAVRDYFGDEISDGDLYALNDPYFGGSHIPDITVICPIYYENRLLFYSVNRAHHSDMGGPTHGGYNPAASEIYQEGLRIPPLKLYEKGVPRRDLLQMLAANVRHPENFLGDLNAQIGSVRTAARRIQALVEAYGPDQLTRCVDEVLLSTERQVRSMIAGWPDGVYRGESLVDDDGFDNKMIPIRAKVTIRGDTMTIDLSDSSPQVTGFINSAYANTRSLAHVAIMYMAPFDVPKNEGSMRPITVI
ncbi:MAG: hydantoinase B/oxoprolinase family protein, partial [Dehalococcoidia bacterium]